MSIVLILVILVPLVLIVMFALFAIGLYNALQRKKLNAENAWSDIDVQLKRRHDLIPNLVNSVKGYASHEKETLEGVTAARSAAVDANGVAAQAGAENMLTQALGKLFAVAEAYPDLKANTNFLQLQDLETLESVGEPTGRDAIEELKVRSSEPVGTIPCMFNPAP